MAEVTGLRNNALPYPIYGAPFGVVFPIFDADGDFVTGATGLDSERSLNGDTFADCTNEATEIATASGQYYLLLTAAELTADVVPVIVKTTSPGAKATPIVLYPRKLVSLRSGTSQAGAAGTITLDSGASAIDDYYNGCVCVATIDGNAEARVINNYVGSTKVASVAPDWNVAPDSDDTFIIYLPEGRQITQALDAAEVAIATAAALATVQSDTDNIQTRIPAALVSGRMDSDVAVIQPNAVNASTLATDAVVELVTALLTTQMTESYAADGVAPTLAQALFMLISGNLEFTISGTTITCKKLDGSTTSMTYLLDSSTTPTSRSRAT